MRSEWNPPGVASGPSAHWSSQRRAHLPVRLIRKYAERIDGVDLRAHAVGDVFELPAKDARLLIAEKWRFQHALSEFLVRIRLT